MIAVAVVLGVLAVIWLLAHATLLLHIGLCASVWPIAWLVTELRYMHIPQDKRDAFKEAAKQRAKGTKR